MPQPNWMDDYDLRDIPKSKLDFLQKLVFEMNKLSQKEKLPFLLALANRMQSEKIQFTSEEVDLIITVLKKHSTTDEVQKMDLMLQKFKTGGH